MPAFDQKNTSICVFLWGFRFCFQILNRFIRFWDIGNNMKIIAYYIFWKIVNISIIICLHSTKKILISVSFYEDTDSAFKFSISLIVFELQGKFWKKIAYYFWKIVNISEIIGLNMTRKIIICAPFYEDSRFALKSSIGLIVFEI